MRQICEKLREATLAGDKWLNDNNPAAHGVSRIREGLRRSGRRLSAYAEAADKKAALAVYGPSQAGKSVLISGLAGSRDQRLSARFGSQTMDFISQINPEGRGETTGLVTRFSFDPLPQPPETDFPVCLRLFSEMDVVKCLANSYFHDSNHSVYYDSHESIGLEELERFTSAITSRLDMLSDLPSRKGSESGPGYGDMEDLRDYVNGLGRNDPFLKILERYYWPQALELGARLDQGGRSALFSILWGGAERCTDVYERLYQALKSLDFADTAFCPISALNSGDPEKGREYSIIHVDRLKGLLEDGGEPEVPIRNRANREVKLSRALLSALTAELCIEVERSPGHFMDKADLLDFPGARSRDKLENFHEATLNAEQLKNCFLRGKVAFLFERYRDLQEINGLVVCVGDSVQEKSDLPSLINEWVGLSHGQTPQERFGKPICLFWVMTKFDLLIEEDAGSTDLVWRWNKRYEGSLLDFKYSDDSHYNWLDDWSARDQGRWAAPFNNLFWLTKPEKHRELQAKNSTPEHQAMVRDLKEAYLRAEGTIKHVAEPEQAWNAVMESDDGGIGYLKCKIAQVAKPELKDEQLEELIRIEADSIYSSLHQFYHDEIDGGLTAEKKEAAKMLAAGLNESLEHLSTESSRRANFGEFLRLLQLSDTDCHELFLTIKDEPGLRTDQPESKTASTKALDKLYSKIKKSAEPSRTARPRDLAFGYRDRLEKAWDEHLEALGDDERWMRYFSLNRPRFKELMHELKQGAKRLKVMDQIEELLRETTSYSDTNIDTRIWMLACQASALLSGYINRLDKHRSHNKKERSVIIELPDGTDLDITVFESRPDPGPYPVLSEDPLDYDTFSDQYYTDWMVALTDLVLGNACSESGDYDHVQNSKLAGITDSIMELRHSLEDRRM
ncbi:hypothetical protein C4J81_01745 [Deltaproteobacteria bacterium Smac51]|nr:hypothetical protein C4J81_01745 [Deltaproteobacteria bacterium Smac51]